MLVSILHRVTGVGMALVGVPLFLWWLASLASGPKSYAVFVDVFTLESGGFNILGYLLAIGLSFAFFQHMMSGIRHLVMDTGAGFELKVNKTYALLTMVGSSTLTLLFWAYQLGVK